MAGGHTLAALAERLGLELRGAGDTLIAGVCTLSPGEPGRISFLANPKYRGALAQTRASAVIVGPRDADSAPGPVLVARDPYLAYARVARLFDPDATAVIPAGVHPSAVVDATARIDPTASIGPLCVIEAGAVIGARAVIGAQSQIGAEAVIGDDSRLEGRNWVGRRCELGARCRLLPGAVIGGRGFGLAPTSGGWEEVPQLGRVRIGDDVEVGANTCIDRGAIDDTVIGNGVKLDNLIQIAHNVRIGDRTAIAAMTGVAGSTTIGSGCLIGGAVGIAGHIEIADNVVVLARAMVTHSLTEAGAYGSGLPVAPAREWRRQVARIRRLEHLDDRVAALEAATGLKGDTASGAPTDD